MLIIRYAKLSMITHLQYATFLAVKNIRTRAVQSLLTVLIVGLAAALGVTVAVLADGVQRGIIQAADAFGVLVIGPKGSAQQLVLSTILLQGVPVGLIDESAYAEITRQYPNVRIAPLAFADNIGGLTIIGTDANFFQLRRSPSEPPAFQAVQGRVFTAPFEAVLGSEAATRLGLRIGDRFNSAHGVSGRTLESDVHTEFDYTVTGILAPTGSPYDRAVITSIDTIWTTHDALNAIKPGFRVDPAADDEKLVRGKVTAALIIPFTSSYTDIYRISQTINNGVVAQAAFPGQQLGGLFDLLSQSTQVLDAVRWLALVMAGLTVLLSLYGTTVARLNAIAIMRSLGANRASIFLMIVIEAVGLTALGVLFGVITGHLTAALIGNAITRQSAIPVITRVVWDQEWVLIVVPILIGLIAGLIPAARAYRLNVVETLTAN